MKLLVMYARCWNLLGWAGMSCCSCMVYCIELCHNLLEHPLYCRGATHCGGDHRWCRRPGTFRHPTHSFGLTG